MKVANRNIPRFMAIIELKECKLQLTERKRHTSRALYATTMAEVLKNFGTNVRISGPFQTIPLEWFSPSKPTYSTRLLRAVDSKPTDRALKIKTSILLGTIVVIIFQTILDFTHNSNTIQSGMSSSVAILNLSLSYLHIHFCRILAQQIVLLINGLLQFENLYKKPKRKLSNMSVFEILNRMMIKLVILSYVLLPLGIVFGFHWNHPWKASLAGYWLIPKPNTVGTGIFAIVLTTILKHVVLFFKYWVWMFGIMAPVFVVGAIHSSCIDSLFCSINT